MACVTVESQGQSFDEPVLLDGLPGAGLVGKLVVDHLLDAFEMEYHAGVYCEGVPQVAAYQSNASAVRPPVQVFADPDHDVLALTSDVPVSPSEAPEFADCLTDWIEETAATPVFLGGLPESFEVESGARSRELYGLSTGDGDELLDRAGIVPPRDPGNVTGPTGALLHQAQRKGIDGVGLLVECTAEFPDLEAAQLVVEHGIEPIAAVRIDTDPFADRTIEMSPTTQEFIETIRESDDGATRAQPTATFH